MNVFSVKYFMEIALSTIINCMEGYYKCMHKSDASTIITKRNGKKEEKYKDFKDIMAKYLDSNVGNMIFSDQERKDFDIDNRLTNHRNYFAHLNEPKERFYGESNLYVLLKIKLLFRSFILTDIGQDIETGKLCGCIKDIEEYIKMEGDFKYV